MREPPSAAEPTPVEQIQIRDIAGRQRLLELAVGDATATRHGSPLDLLVISAFPDDYAPIPGTVIASLKASGIDVAALADAREYDWRDTWQCWLSRQIDGSSMNRDADGGQAISGIRRLLCFEHALAQGRPEELVGNVFRSIRHLLLTEAPLQPTAGDPHEMAASLNTVRMPLLSAGSQGHSPSAMLAAIVEQAVVHLVAGLPVDRIQVVIHDGHRHLHRLLVEFGRLTTDVAIAGLLGYESAQSPSHDLFLSYRRTDEAIARRLVDAVMAKRRGMRVFVDQEGLAPGCHWKPALLKALAECRNAMCVVTDGYPTSPECVDEFHAAVCLARARPGYLLPLLCLTNQPVDALPSSLRRVNFIPATCPPAAVDDVATTILRHMDGR